MSHSPIDESHILDYAPPERGRWRRWLRRFAYLMPLWCVVLVSMDIFAEVGLGLRTFGIPGWHIAEALSLITGVACFACGERRATVVSFGMLALLFVAEPRLNRAT